MLGGLAGLLAAFGASLIGYLLAENVFQLDYRFSFTLWLAGLALGSLVVGATRIAATRKAVNEPPVTVLRTG